MSRASRTGAPSPAPVRWAGVDVGGPRKGFHVAVIDDRALVAGPQRVCAPTDVLSWLRRHDPLIVAIDGPCTAAPPGARWRSCERALARSVCGIRWTPDAAAIAENPYYAWVVQALALFRLVEGVYPTIECFPTASWTRWAGPRLASRAAWSAQALASVNLDGLPSRLGQDGRDAVGAALTARSHSRGETERFGEIVVPKPDV
jgi:predicted nuclease with RNAse H fold